MSRKRRRRYTEWKEPQKPLVEQEAEALNHQMALLRDLELLRSGERAFQESDEKLETLIKIVEKIFQDYKNHPHLAWFTGNEANKQGRALIAAIAIEVLNKRIELVNKYCSGHGSPLPNTIVPPKKASEVADRRWDVLSIL
jgi:hypothetical protein